MLFERVVSEGLAHNSYIVGSGGKAAVIDPRRDCDCYLDFAVRNDLTITHIFETHRNEDYVIGSPELAQRCPAAIFHGEKMAFSYGNPVREGELFTIGALELTILETPGHTDESISLVLRNKEIGDQPFMVFSGDTLFAGDIARTDFFGRVRDAEMAGRLYDSIAKKILPLGDNVIICPAHGAGSVCGEEIADLPFTTVGYEKMTNPSLLAGRNKFIAKRIAETPYVPPYFRQMEHYNKEGAPILHRLPDLRPLPIEEINLLREHQCHILDIRSPTSFGAGHIPGSISIWRDGIPAFAGWFLDYLTPIVLIDDFDCDLEMVLRQMIRLGYDNIRGYLAGGFPAWFKGAQETGTIPTCTVQQLHEVLGIESPFLLDVRDIKNWRSVGHIRGAHHRYVGELPEHMDEVPRDEPVFVYCDAGYKGGLASSLLARKHYRNITNVLGGMTAWKRAGYPVDR